jgi:hypothetical protein
MTKHDQWLHWGNDDIAEDEVRRTLAAFMEPGQVTEIRALDAVTGATGFCQVYSGYFDHADALLDSIFLLPKSRGIYFLPNPVVPSLLARAHNRLRPARREPLTSDRDILRRRFLPIDVDPRRPAGISSTDAELRAAIDRVHGLIGHLTSAGWPDPILALSGNGAHACYLIDLAAEDHGIVSRTLESLALRFDDDSVTVDTTVHNPARIWRLYGTRARKGDDVPDRPHRHSRLLNVPNPLQAVPHLLLANLAAEAPHPEAGACPPRQTHHQAFDLEAWIHGHNLDVDSPQPWQDGRRWVFRDCPWEPSHKDRSAYIVQLGNGAIAAGCHHASCRGHGWHDLRDLVDPGWRDCVGPPVISLPPNVPPSIRLAFHRAARRKSH